MTIRNRRNIDCLGTESLHDLREGLQRMFDLPEDHPESWAVLGGIHGSPAPTWCDHGAPGFLTWHRAYMLAFESALRAVGCTTALPFWDWSSGPTTGVPAACREATYVNRQGDTVPNPLYAAPIATAAGGGTTNRRADIDTTTFGDIAVAAQAAMGNGSFAGFQSSLNGPHGSVHVRTGGDMASVSHAGFDPLFFLHHCNVDRLWWQWQQAHPGAGLPAAESVHPLDPFPRPFDDDWMTGADVVSAASLGYGYTSWCLFIPPIIIWELIAIELPIPVTRLARDARLVVRAASMPAESVELRVFIGEEEAVRDDSIDRNPAFAGTIGLFGMGERMKGGDRMAGTFDVALDVTEHLRRTCAPGRVVGRAGDDADETEQRDDAVHEKGGRAPGSQEEAGRLGTRHDEGHAHGRDHHHGPTEQVVLRVAAFDADGRPLRDDRGLFDRIELVVE